MGNEEGKRLLDRSARLSIVERVRVTVSLFHVFGRCLPLWSLFFLSACSADEEAKLTDRTEVQGFRVVATYDHNPRSFTQGLVYSGEGMLLEGSGLYGKSAVRLIELDTGRTKNLAPIERRYFGEGITLWENQIVQLTWKSGTGFVYDAKSLKRIGTFEYESEGWGITHDGERLIVSDGSDTLQFWDPQTFERVGSVRVTDGGKPVRKLNELEYIEGEVWANVWQTNRIARIDPSSGSVAAWIDFSGLHPRSDGEVMNGIAYDAERKRIFVTGKLWSKLYEVEVTGVTVE